MASNEQPKGPDLAQGIPISSLADGALIEGHVAGEPVLVAKRGEELFALGAKCTHYGAPLAEGLQVGETVRCPWHHACFSLRTGEALTAPAFASLDRWQVERRGELVVIAAKLEPQSSVARPAEGRGPSRIVIVGGGAAGFAAAEMLRRRGFAGELTMLSADDAAPYDRPNLSKDYLAGEASEEWIPLQGPEFYADKRIELRLSTPVQRIDVGARAVVTADGRSFPFDRLLLATGAEPVRLSIPGAELPHVFTLRSLATAAPLSNVRRRQKTRSCSAPASSGSRSPAPCGRAASRCMPSLPIAARWRKSSDLSSAISSVRSTSGMACAFICRIRRHASTGAGSCLRAARRSMPISSSRASA